MKYHNHWIEFLTRMLSKEQPKVIHMCLAFGGQNHIRKAVIKMRPIAFLGGILSSISNLCTELLICIICVFREHKSLEMKASILVKWALDFKASL